MEENQKISVSECKTDDLVYTDLSGLKSQFTYTNSTFYYIYEYKVISPQYGLCIRTNGNGYVCDNEKPTVLGEVYLTKKAALLAAAQNLQGFVDDINKTINKIISLACDGL